MRYVYHVTYASRLPSIAKLGLVPGRRPVMGGDFDDCIHCSKIIFFTEQRGLRKWVKFAQDAAYDSCQDFVRAKHIPIVCRVQRPKGLICDEPGSKDARAPAFCLKGSVPPSSIEVWVDGRWIPIRRAVSKIQPSRAVRSGWFLKDTENPFVPAMAA